ncbi:sn-glycerol-3-phosphate ABC transporter ATP-binding protein UgpC [Myxococcota bacterium]|nr:sn-glycerol-3-phosphate ABC transporter ATP-binding protein UgpC [Myxococcota bacterium]
MASVTFRNVVKSYGEVVVVPKMDLSIPDGKFTVLVGPSGCGKSTTLRMIAGLEEVTSGDLLIGEKRVNDVLPRDRDIAMVFQSYALYPHMSVRDNMAFGLKLRGMPAKEIETRVSEASTMLGLDPLLDRRPKALSGGQRQRVAMGRAIVRRPQVFLFDEPLSNLDAKLRGEMRREIARLHQRLATTIVYVTHDQVEAMTLADRIVVMEKGYIRQIGQPLELYHRPDNKFVAGFIGSPTMNFFDLDVKSDSGKSTLAGPGFSLPVPERFDVAGHERVCLGIRPEGGKVVPVEEKAGILKATVEVVEPLGAEIHLTLGSELGPLTVVVGPDRLAAVGDAVGVAFPADALHLFSLSEGQGHLRRAADKEA